MKRLSALSLVKFIIVNLAVKPSSRPSIPKLNHDSLFSDELYIFIIFYLHL